ncbi:ABC transporter permease [Tundrisphaera lichenicola]|uniref:ABC transporter permease n=1 Tax=Tundrisphaera lichenicola TaxID=2029860 RepID=UPI003EBD1B34
MDEAEVGAKPNGVRLRGALGWAWTVFGPFLGLVLITLLFAWLTGETGSFLTAYNWRTIAVQTVIVGTAALGMTVIMIAGGIDLSVGSAVALVTVSVAILVRDYHWPVLGALVAGVALGGGCGLLNGGLISGLRVVPFIITLGTLKVFRGLAKWLSDSTPVYIPGDSKRWWFHQVMAIDRPPAAWASRWSAGVGSLVRDLTMLAPGVWLLLGLSLLVALMLRSSLLGRYAFAVGSNESTARLCGLSVPRIKLAVYGLAGVLTGLAGCLQFLYLDGTGDPTTADGLELQVIAAVVIGGGSLSGGEGTVLGTLIGCLIMSVLNNGCVHAGIPNASQDVIIGIIIVAAVALDRFRRRSAA